ncbi:hypothetical protein D3C72_2004680 [compost metagenome]
MLKENDAADLADYAFDFSTVHSADETQLNWHSMLEFLIIACGHHLLFCLCVRHLLIIHPKCCPFSSAICEVLAEMVF